MLLCLALIFGESISGYVLPTTRTFLSLTPLFVIGCTAVALRHIFCPRPSMWRVLIGRSTNDAAFERSQRGALAVALGSRLAVLLIGYIAVVTIGYQLKPLQFRLSRNEVWNLPGRFDAGWYLGLARRGYQWRPELADRQQNIAFFPLYPLSMRVAGDLVTIPAKLLHQPTLFGGGDTRVTWGGVVVSVVSFCIALPRLRRFALLKGATPAQATFSVWLLALYPFSLFFSQAYSEALFLLEVISLFLAWQLGQYRACTGWGLAAGLTRSNGWTLTLALLLDSLLTRQVSRTRILSALAPIGGASLFSLFSWQLTGAPLAWMHAQVGWGAQGSFTRFFGSHVNHIAAEGVTAYVSTNPVGAITLIVVCVALGMTVVLLFKREWLMAIYIAAYLSPALYLNLEATGRMTAVLFPVFITLAWSIPSTRLCRLPLLFAFAAGQAYFSARFHLWQTPY